jgi:hypothetical protein
MQTGSNAPQTVPKAQLIAKILPQKSAQQWIVAAVLGGVAISWFGTPEIGKSQSIFFRLSIPVLIIAIYAWSGHKNLRSVINYPALRTARVGQLADSVYFLGFLWTLWALIDSFVLHDLSITEAVFRAFGYALVTTASGMFLRLALLQFSYSAEDQVPLSEQQIEVEIIRFSNAIVNAVKSLEGFKTQSDTAQNKWVESLNNSTQALKAAVDNVGTQTASLKEALVEMQNTNTQHVNRLIESALSQFAQKMQPPLEAVNDSVKKMEHAVNAGVKNIELAIERGTKKTQADLDKHSAAINTKLMKSSDDVEKATTSLAESLPKQMASLVSNLADVSKQIRNIHVSPDIVEKTIVQQSTAFSEAFNKSLMASTMSLQKAIDELSRSVLDATRQIRSNERLSFWERLNWERLKIWK